MTREELKDKIKDYIQYCRAHRDELLNIQPTNKFGLPNYVKEKVDFHLNRTFECSTTGGADGYMTPFAFCRRGGIGNVKSAEMFGFKLVNKKRSPKKECKKIAENQMYPGFAGIVPTDDIDLVPSFIDSDGLPQHNDPNEDPALDGLEQSAKAGQNSMYEKKNKKKMIKLKDLIVKEDVALNNLNTDNPQQHQRTQQTIAKQPASVETPVVNVSTYNIQNDFSQFDLALKNCTEQTKIKYQKAIQDKIIGRKIVLRASKGYKQPESDYTVNVTGVQLDFYYDRYVIIVVGREEKKQKVGKFFVKPGFKIKILGAADTKGNDNYQIAKSRALVSNPSQSTDNINTKPNTNVTASN